MTEPSPFFDPGPYETKQRAADQVAAIMYGVPAEVTEQTTAAGFVGELVLMDALLRAGIQPAGWEDVARQEIARTLPPEVVQVVAGWVVRARLAGGPETS